MLVYTGFCSRDLDLHLMTLTYEPSLAILKNIPGYQKRSLGEGFQKLQHKQDGCTDRQTDRCDQIHYHRRICG